jgi:hypothetical protein
VLLATLFHASLNLVSPGGLNPRRQEIVEVIVYRASAGVVRRIVASSRERWTLPVHPLIT